jgi:hypothetical protein
MGFLRLAAALCLAAMAANVADAKKKADVPVSSRFANYLLV